MLVKDVMKKTLIKHYENDYIEDVIQKVIAREDEGGLVYNDKDQLIGCFTHKELLLGVGRKVKTLQSIFTNVTEVIEENCKIELLQFSQSDICPVRNKNGDITGFITKADYLEAIARTAKVERNQLDAIFNSAHNGILSIDVEGKITAMNPPAEKMSLMSSEEAIGKFLTDVVTPSGLLDVIRTGEGHSEKYSVGQRVYLTRRSPIFDGNKLVGAVGVFQDVSELEAVSQELDSVKQLINELETFINYSSDGICITDNRGRVLRENSKFKNLCSSHSITEECFLSIIRKVVKYGKTYDTTESRNDKKQMLQVIAHPLKNSKGYVEKIILNVQEVNAVESFTYELYTDNWSRKKLDNPKGIAETFVSDSMVTKEIVNRAKKLAKTDVTILLTGEKSVGKETLAKLIHENSSRSEKPFIKIDCQTISKEQMAYEFFGYESKDGLANRGKSKIGYFERANGGTIFLKEISQVPTSLQKELLRVLQDQEFAKVGTNENKKIEIRIIVSSSENLEPLIKLKKFREDLYYRINVIPLHIPPLRERIKDLWGLVELFTNSYSVTYGKKIKLTEEMMSNLVKYEWPGNIYELQSVIERLYSTSSKADFKEKSISYILEDGEKSEDKVKQPIIVNEILPLKEAVAELERLLISKVGETEDSYRKIAKVLEVSPSTIIRKLRRENIQS